MFKLPVKYRIFDKKLFIFSMGDKWVFNKNVNGNTYIPITQGFGNDFIYNKDEPVGWKGKWFYKEIISGLQGHNGIDFVAPIYAGLYAPEDGIISKTSITYGKAIYLQGSKYEHIFGHLHDILVMVGQQVKKGQLIGYCNNTGLYTTAPHLHWGVRPVNHNFNNGYNGYIDHRNMIDNLEVYNFPDVYQQIDEYRIETGVEFNKTIEWKKIQKKFNTSITRHDFHHYLDIKKQLE